MCDGRRKVKDRLFVAGQSSEGRAPSRPRFSVVPGHDGAWPSIKTNALRLFGPSWTPRERVRQIESRAIEKLRRFITPEKVEGSR